ncbi:MAG: PEGA domain-containing protein [Spirochaetaceae bacterium]|nr:PEGA domain-containing protein [Spirochaetaceae bacterium]
MKNLTCCFAIIIFFLLFFPSTLFAAADASIYVTTKSPYGASVYIDGSYKGTTPLHVKVSSGYHTVTVSKTGYESYYDSVNVPSGKEVSITVTLKQNTGSIHITTNIPGVSVYLDYSFKGYTPLTIDNVSPGYHTIRLTKTNYDDITKQVYVSVGYVNNLTETFIGSDLTITSNKDGASVYIDNVYKGTTPLTLRDIEPGNHRVKVSKTHYQIVENTVILKQGSAKTLDVDLIKISGYLNVTTDPDFASVYLGGSDGTLIWKTNNELDEGPYNITVRCFGYNDKAARVNISRNNTTDVSIKLDPAKFYIKSLYPETPSFNPTNKKVKSTVNLKWSVTTPEKGLLSVLDENGNTLASWNLTFSTWDGSVSWDGMVNGTPVNPGEYTVILTVGKIEKRTTVLVDYTIEDYLQETRNGFYFDIGSASGLNLAFCYDFSITEHIFGVSEIALRFPKNDVINRDSSHFALDLLGFVGASFNYFMIRPFIMGGLGFSLTKHGGLMLSGKIGSDFTFDGFVLGVYLGFKYCSGGEGNTVGSFGVTIGLDKR